MKVAALLFDEFELLDVFGPLEMLGMLPEHFEIHLVAENKGAVKSAQGPASVIDESFSHGSQYDIVLVPGGQGTRTQVNNAELINWIQIQSRTAKYITSVCTGSVLLAKSGILNGKKATTNKLAFDWVKNQAPQVQWMRHARWVQQGNVFTSSGVSAGMDMTLALIAHIFEPELAQQVALWAEYQWNNDPQNDPFSVA